MTGFAHSIAGGQGNLVAGSFQSPGFISGVFGWQVTRDGNAEFNNGTFRGTVTGSVFDGTDFEINSAGAFFYSPAPGAGSLVASIAAIAGTDKFGNAYLQGIVAYGPSGEAVQLLPSVSGGAVPQLALTPGGQLFQVQAPAAYAGIAGAGTSAERYALNLTSGYTSAVAGSAFASSFYFQGAAADGSADGFMQAVVASAAGSLINAFKITPTQAIFAPTVTAQDPGGGSGTAETWHNITLDSGWSTVETAQYRKLPDGNVQVRGQISHTGTAGAADINNSSPLDAAYRPGATRYYRPPQAGDTAGAVQISSAGVLAMRASGFTATQAILDGIYSI